MWAGLSRSRTDDWLENLSVHVRALLRLEWRVILLRLRLWVILVMRLSDYRAYIWVGSSAAGSWCLFSGQIVLVAPLTLATFMTHHLTPLLILVLATSYLLMVYVLFAAVQRFVRRREQMLKWLIVSNEQWFFWAVKCLLFESVKYSLKNPF